MWAITMATAMLTVTHIRTTTPTAMIMVTPDRRYSIASAFPISTESIAGG
jgi:hypothetical protein